MQDITKPQELRLASYNIRKAKGTDRRRDPGRILDVVNALEADVIALQEADMRLGNRPAALERAAIERHTDFNVLPIARSEVSIGWHGNAILLRKGLQHHKITHIALPGLEPRGAVRVDLDAPQGLSLVAAHLGLARRSRRQQLAVVAKALRGARHAAVLGDFNEWSKTRGLEALQPDYVVHAPGRSFHASRPIVALDRIALSHSIALSDAGVLETPLTQRASDHLPIWGNISLPA